MCVSTDYLCLFVYSQILSEAALSLSSPNSKQKKRKAIEELSPRILKPWQQVVEERIKTKTRIISKVIINKLLLLLIDVVAINRYH